MVGFGSQNLQNITKMSTKIDPKSMKNRGCVADAFLERFGGAKVRLLIYFPVNSGAIFDQKSKKWHPKSHPKINAEKESKNYAKRLQNEAKMDAEIHDFSYFFEKGENLSLIHI